jgi:hypothetical protein
MGCVVNGPGECEGADIAIFAGDRRGIIYVQGEKSPTCRRRRSSFACWRNAASSRPTCKAAKPSSARRKSTSSPRPHRRTGQRLGKNSEGTARSAGHEIEGHMKLGRLIVDAVILAAGAAGGIYWGVNHPNQAADIAQREQIAADKAKVEFLAKFGSHIPKPEECTCTTASTTRQRKARTPIARLLRLVRR